MNDTPPRSPLGLLRRRAGGKLIEGFFHGISVAGKLHPDSRLEKHHVERLRDLAYRDTGLGAHRLDVYRSTIHQGPRPIAFYVHGGGFRILSKETHWLMGLIFARRGFLTFSINYRLAPEHRFPAALEDTCSAYEWVLENAERFGGDPSRIVLAGESAGANLVTSLTIASCYPRPEPYARRIFDLGARPRVVAPACGIFEVSRPERFLEGRKISRFVRDRIFEVSHGYLPKAEPEAGALDLADPLVVLERGDRPERPLPPFFLPVGTRDPLKDDAQRMEHALTAMGVPCEARYYPGEVHAFHALIWREAARECWRDKFEFIFKHLDAE